MSALILNTARISALRKIVANGIQQNNIRLISTSDKKRDTATVACPSTTKTESNVATNKNWVSYGFDYKDEANDRSSMKGSFFFSVTLCLVWGTFIWSYLPDTQYRDWSQRQGFLELRRREAAGLEPISRNYFDESSIQLPSDEELGKTEIII